MAEKPDTTMRVKKWAGRISNASPHVIPLGAAIDQNNVRAQNEGQLDVRPGMRTVLFSNTTTAVADEIIAAYTFPGELNDMWIYETSGGAIKAGRSPSIA
jgi:hypothetical protein